jgi:hypothetical protein
MIESNGILISKSPIDRTEILSQNDIDKLQKEEIDNFYKNYKPFIPIIDIIETRIDSPSIWQIILFLITKSSAIIKSIYIIVSLLGKLQMTNDLKTTVAGIIQAICAILGIIVHFTVSADIQEVLISVIVGIFAIFTYVKGLFTNKPDIPQV